MTAALSSPAEAVADWRTLRTCDITTAHLFDEDDEGNYPHEAQAKSLCAQCPVRMRCLDEAMRAAEPQGIWGGLTPEERSSYKRMWRRQGGRVNRPRPCASAAAESRYEIRLSKAYALREKLLELPVDYTLRIEHVGTYRRDDFLQLADMVIANPTQSADVLAARLSRSQSWFNCLFRHICDELGVEAA